MCGRDASICVCHSIDGFISLIKMESVVQASSEYDAALRQLQEVLASFGAHVDEFEKTFRSCFVPWLIKSWREWHGNHKVWTECVISANGAMVTFLESIRYMLVPIKSSFDEGLRCWTALDLVTRASRLYDHHRHPCRLTYKCIII
jgi:hypothetical protein